MSQDDRNGKPSASSFSRYDGCNGAYTLEQLVPEPSLPGSDATIGNLIHSALAGEKVTLDEEATATFEMCNKHREQVRESIAFEGEGITSIVEQRYWYDDLFSGQVDCLEMRGATAWVYDYKTGRNPVSKQNLQMMAYAVLVKKNHPEVEVVYCTIIQPLCGNPHTTIFEGEDLDQAKETILALVDAINAPDATRNPGEEQCRYCKAISICPEAKSLTIMVEKLPTESLSNEAIGQLLAILPVVEKQCDSIKALAKERLKAGQIIPGYTLKDGRQTRSISDASGAYNALSSGMSAEAFASACKVSVTQLEKAWATATGLKGKAAKESLEASLGSYLETKTSDQVLSKEKGDA